MKVIILPGGKTAREINKVDKPIRSQMGGLAYINKMIKWENAESKLRTFEIENWFFNLKIIDGKEYTAQILENGKVKIL